MCKRIIKHEEGWPALKLFARGWRIRRDTGAIWGPGRFQPSRSASTGRRVPARDTPTRSVSEGSEIPPNSRTVSDVCVSLRTVARHAHAEPWGMPPRR